MAKPLLPSSPPAATRAASPSTAALESLHSVDSIQISIREPNWKHLMQRVEWTPSAGINSGKNIDELRGGELINLIAKGHLAVRDTVVRKPVYRPSRFRVPSDVLASLLCQLVPKPGGVLSNAVWNTMDATAKLQVFCRGHCTLASHLLAEASKANVAAEKKQKCALEPKTAKKRTRLVREELDEGASFLLSLGKEDEAGSAITPVYE